MPAEQLSIVSLLRTPPHKHGGSQGLHSGFFENSRRATYDTEHQTRLKRTQQHAFTKTILPDGGSEQT
jgi:hypothetical protein